MTSEHGKFAPGNAQLPLPEPAAVAHSESLEALIRKEMAEQGGSIPFRRFMELALYAPGLGYYSAGAAKLGDAGDFVTAPELSPLFSQCIANAIAPVLTSLPEQQILEVGAGSGRMAADILRRLAVLDCLPECYAILELSADLQDRQRQTLQTEVPEYFERVQWLSSIPKQFTGVVLANEVLDAMPVQRFHLTKDGVYEQYVAAGDDGFFWQDAVPSDPRLAARVEAITQQSEEGLAPGYVSEINLAAEDWLRTLADSLVRGVILLIDYGFPRHEFYHPQRGMGTLMCHYRHRAHTDPLILTGLQDITAHVDFTAIAEAATAAGLELAGYTSQAHFLLDSGLSELVTELDLNDIARHMRMVSEIKKLTLPHEMGELFKVMALSKASAVPLPGFRQYDMRERL